MKWNETTASECRYGDVIGEVLGSGEVIWEHSMSDYQGSANVLVAMPDGTFVHYEWTYGSCSGCDEWEYRGLTDEQIIEEVRRSMGVLKDRDALRRYLHLEGEFTDAQVPSANGPTNGSIPGMLRVLFGGIAEEFREMATVAGGWMDKQED